MDFYAEFMTPNTIQEAQAVVSCAAPSLWYKHIHSRTEVLRFPCSLAGARNADMVSSFLQSYPWFLGYFIPVDDNKKGEWDVLLSQKGASYLHLEAEQV